MKWNEMQNLFIGYNKDENFRILICALDKWEASELAREYGLEACIEGDWKISETDLDENDTHFDCDYVITGGQ